MFYGTVSSYIEFLSQDTQFSITLMCWVQPGGHDGPLVIYGGFGDSLFIEHGKFLNQIVFKTEDEGIPVGLLTETTEVFPAGKWVHVAASYDYSSGSNSLFINGHLRASQKIGPGYYRIANASRRVRLGAGDFYRGYFKGKIAEMKVYDLALNEALIQASIRQGSCTFFEIVFLLPSLVIPLITVKPNEPSNPSRLH